MKIIKVTATILLFIFLSFSYAVAQGFTNLSDCLVTNDIGIFTYDSEYSLLGNACGVVGGADHFKLDHTDSICSGSYSKNVDVSGLSIKEINGNKIIGRRGNGYRWLSNNVVVDVSYTDLQGNKPEPLEVVQAYLVKFPSTITITDTIFKTSDNNIKWIKDEMDRRLWLCDKWNTQSQAGGVTQADLMVKLLENMTVFLKYRDKYFGVAAKNEEIALGKYHENNGIASFKAKLTEYKTWWAKHKDKSFKL